MELMAKNQPEGGMVFSILVKKAEEASPDETAIQPR